MEIRHLRYFIAVAEARSFARGARNLNMSQPPLSKRIADLEAELGVKLLNRTSKKVALTTSGEMLLPHARIAVRAFDAALRQARSLSSRRSRRLRIGLSGETSQLMLADIMSRLQQKQAEVNLVEASTADQQSLLLAGAIDIGILRHPFEADGLWLSEPLAQPLGVMMHDEHPLTNLDTLHLADLGAFPLVQFHRSYAPGLYDELLELCSAGGYVPPSILNCGRLIAPVLKTDSAVAFVPEWSLRSLAGQKDFIWRPLEGSPLHWWTSVVCRSDECVGLTAMAIATIFSALQEHEGWVPMPRPATGRPNEGELTAPKQQRARRGTNQDSVKRA